MSEAFEDYRCLVEDREQLLAQNYELRARVAELQAAYDLLTGEKFSDRVHAVLRAKLADREARLADAERWQTECAPLLDYLTGSDQLCESPVDYAKELQAQLVEAKEAIAALGVQLLRAAVDTRRLADAEAEAIKWARIAGERTRLIADLTESLAFRKLAP